MVGYGVMFEDWVLLFIGVGLILFIAVAFLIRFLIKKMWELWFLTTEQLEWLKYFDPQITDAGLKVLAKLPKLTKLNLGGTTITDAGLKEVAKLEKLTYLNLNETQITDAGLEEVAKMKQLQELTLTSTKVTKAGVAQFQKALPKCEIKQL